MPLNLNTEKVYETFIAKCTELKCPTKTKEELSIRLLEAFYYLLSSMVEEKTSFLTIVFKLTEDIACFIAPFKNGHISIIFNTPKEIEERLKEYKQLVENQIEKNLLDFNPTQLF